MNQTLLRRAALSILPLLAVNAYAQGQPGSQDQDPPAVQAFNVQCRPQEKKAAPESAPEAKSSAVTAPAEPTKPDCDAMKKAARDAAERKLAEVCAKEGLDRCSELLERFGGLFTEEKLKALRAGLGQLGTPRKPSAAAAGQKAADKNLEGMRDALAAGPSAIGLGRYYDNSQAAGNIPAVGTAGAIFVAERPSLNVGIAGPTASMPGDRSLDSFHPPAPKAAGSAPEGPTVLGAAASYAWGGTKRVLHAGGAVLALPFEAVGTTIQGAAGAVDVVGGSAVHAFGWGTESAGGALSWLGGKLGSSRLSSAGDWLSDKGAVVSVAGGRAAARGEALVGGSVARAANAVVRPVTSLVAPDYELVSMKPGSTFNRFVGATSRILLDGRDKDGLSAADVAVRAHTDSLIGARVDQMSREENPVLRYGGYALALTASAADKASQALLGGGVLKDMAGRTMQLLGLGSMGLGVGEQGVEHAKELANAKGRQETEAAVVKTLKSGLDLAAMMASGSKGKEAEQGASAAARGGEDGPRFLTRQEAGSLVGAAEAQLRNLKQKLAESGAKPLTPEEESRAYHIFLDEFAHPANHPPQKAPGGIGIFDNDSGLSMRDADSRWLGERGIVVDHHGAYYDAANPEVNTTMKVLGSIEKGLAETGDPQRVVADLRRQYPNISSDNVGDFGWTNWILRNPERVAKDPALRSLITRATHYEDFGFFGEKARQAAAADPAAAEAQQLQNAVFRVYDEAMQGQGLAGSDRFPDLHPTRQRAMLAEVEKGMTQALDDPTFRESKAREFKSRMEDAQRQVEAARFGLDDASRAKLAEAGVPESAMDGVFVYDAGKIKADGIFAGWGAAPQSHGSELLLGIRPMGGRTGFIYSVPNGMEAPALTSVGAALRAAEAAKDVGGEKPGSVGGRDALQFSFDGLHMTPQELLMEVAKARAEAARKAAAEAPAPKPDLPREQKPSGLQGRLQEIRGRERAAEAARPWEAEPRLAAVLPEGIQVSPRPMSVGSAHSNVYEASYARDGRAVQGVLKVDARPSEAATTWRAGQVPLPSNVHVTRVLAAETWNASTLKRYGLEGSIDPWTADCYIRDGRHLMLMEKLPEDSVSMHHVEQGERRGIASPEARADLMAAAKALNSAGITHGDYQNWTNVRWRRDPATGEDHFYLLDFGNGGSRNPKAGASSDVGALEHMLAAWQRSEEGR